MLAPKVVGRILQALKVQPHEQVTGSRYGLGFSLRLPSAAGRGGHSLEIFADLAEQARRNLAAAGIARRPDGRPVMRWACSPVPARFDAIVVTASLPVYDSRFEAQLKPGGRLFVVVGEGAAMDARLITIEASGQRRQESLFETVLDPLVNALRIEHFRF